MSPPAMQKTPPEKTVYEELWSSLFLGMILLSAVGLGFGVWENNPAAINTATSGMAIGSLMTLMVDTRSRLKALERRDKS
jgi:hypothetical protein